MGSKLGRSGSVLIMPEAQPDRFMKVYGAGVYFILVELEDALSTGKRPFARGQLVRAQVRVNAGSMPWHADDLLMLAS
jgi:citrate lyase beta subunit